MKTIVKFSNILLCLVILAMLTYAVFTDDLDKRNSYLLEVIAFSSANICFKFICRKDDFYE